jgi:hypothetical protein
MLMSRKSTASPAGTVETFELSRWVFLCALAEAIGMTAAAGATLLAEAIIPAPRSPFANTLVLVLIVGGGLIEGIALGVLQSAGLVRWVPAFSRRRWILWTTLVAGLGWAAASAPAQFAASADTSPPSLIVLVGGALLLGALMGSLLGAAQAGGFRGKVARPWRWIGISVLAWAPTMAVIFVGATTPDSGWPPVATLPLATATGAVAGAVLGLVSGALWPVVHAPSWSHAFVVGLLKSRAGGLLDRSLVVLRLRGQVTGRTIELPAQYAVDGDALIILPGRPAEKRWWRNLQEPSSVNVLVGGEWRTGEGRALTAHQNGYQETVKAYRTRWDRVPVPPDGFPVIVRIELDQAPVA